jgi:8-oxo-dGTP diphosphatase
VPGSGPVICPMSTSGLTQNTAHNDTKQPFHIAVAVVANARSEVLIARRPPDAHQGGLWEFPGGKVGSGEDVVQALKRELKEEVGIDIELTRLLIKTRHRYPDKEVLLDVWRVERWQGEANGARARQLLGCVLTV